MTSQPLNSFLNAKFVHQALRALKNEGFVSDEHDFAPYRETISTHVRAIERELKKEGYKGGRLVIGLVENHPAAGYAYFIYDSARFDTLTEAKCAVSAWLSEKYNVPVSA